MKFDVAIIGGGPAGYTAAEQAAANGLKTILFEKEALGGVCLNEGCIPTKTMLYSAKIYDTIKHASKYAVQTENTSFDLKKIISRKKKVVRKLCAGIKNKLIKNNVEIVNSKAIIKSYETDGTIIIESNDTLYNAKNLLICTGSESIIPPITGLNNFEYWTSKEALECSEVPKSLIIVGGGVIGMEFASFFNSLGTEVHVIEMMDKILGPIDHELSELLQTEYKKRGIKFYLQHKVEAFNNEFITVKTPDNEIIQLKAEKTLLSVGRKPITKELGLENISIDLTKNGIKVNEFMQTSIPNIYACGDITGFSLLAHTASNEGIVAINHILGKNPYKMSYKAIPSVVYTNPEIACIGETEASLQSANIEYKVKKIPMTFSGRFVAENEQVNGLCKFLLSTDGTILGAHILGNPASEIITIAGIAIEQKMKEQDLCKFIFPHPTVSEIIKETLSYD